jgi:hypothetical protein
MSHEARAKAQAVADHVGKGFTIRRALDTSNKNAPCWIAAEDATCAIVVYEDEPDAVVSTGNHEGRFT